MTASVLSADAAGEWLELSVEVDHEAVEPIAALFARFGFNAGVVIEEPFTQDPDGDHFAVDFTRPVTVRTFVARADASEATLDEIRQALWHLGRMRPVGELQITVRKEEDWANAWKEHYRPVRAGRRVVVCPPWSNVERAGDDLVVILDPGMAFGTGTHPTTRLSLVALEATIEQGDEVFDVGTGSGILAIAAVLLGANRVDAVDIEPVSVRQAKENFVRNGVADKIRVELGSAGPGEPFAGQYDVVVANIIARILVEISAGLVVAVKPGGTLLLSGIIEPREADVAAAFSAHGLRQIRREQMEDWVAQVWQAPV